MFKNRRLLALFLAIVTIVVFAGCSAPAAKDEPAPTPAPVSEAPKASPSVATPEAAKSEAPSPEPAKPRKVAMVMSGAINDAGWNQSAYEGLQVIKEKYGAEVAYTENTQQPDFETVIRDYADKGYDLIICHGFQFTDPAKAVAPLFPNSTFAVVNGDTFQEPNLMSFRFNTPDTGFLAGAVAGLATKNNSIAMIGGNKMPHVVDSLTSFEAGAKYVNPNVSIQLGYTETMTDVAKGKEMAMSMIEKGADTIVANADQVGLGVIDAAKTKGITALGYVNDQYSVAPDTILVSIIQSVSDLVVAAAGKKFEEDAKPSLYLFGAKEGVVRLSDWHGNDSKMSPETLVKIDEVYQGILDGSLKEK